MTTMGSGGVRKPPRDTTGWIPGRASEGPLQFRAFPGRNGAMARLDPSDLYDVRSLLSEEERMVQDTVARFTDEKVIPIIGDCFDRGEFPKQLVPEIASLGLLGATLPHQYGGAEMNAVSYGL